MYYFEENVHEKQIVFYEAWCQYRFLLETPRKIALTKLTDLNCFCFPNQREHKYVYAALYLID